MQATQPRTHKMAAEKLPGPCRKASQCGAFAQYCFARRRSAVSSGTFKPFRDEIPGGCSPTMSGAWPDFQGIGTCAGAQRRSSFSGGFFVPAELDAIDWRILKELQDD